MKITELDDLVLLESGQFLLGDDLSAVELDIPKFWTMAKRCLLVYSKYRPVEKQSQLEMTLRSHTFQANVGIGIPDWVSSMVPVSSPSNSLGVVFNKSESSLEPQTNLWEYRNPKIYVTSPGIYDLTTVHQHAFTETKNGNPEVIKDVDMLEITEEDNLFIDLVVGKFLQGIGRSRRAFTLGELPIETDASDMVSEGKELYDETILKLKEEESKWYLGVGE